MQVDLLGMEESVIYEHCLKEREDSEYAARNDALRREGIATYFFSGQPSFFDLSGNGLKGM